ncbi:DUF6000 family protein [Streptomyces sp. NBC_00385]|uniref:DUF6000 family protein n=1 Tax=Streptomyces sp. NBC_00385 TaxID=2975733 RepID=UPI002DD9CB4F|nr:DUF6000 family protein [Streptomyces sp. NBC_00385]WRZ06904.1 DUF6000 family protein [Streptomyces sp. NBC_00385]
MGREERQDYRMRFPRSSDPELLDVIDRYVKPQTQGVGRYLHLLHANFTRDDESERTLFLQSLRAAAQEIADEELEILLESEWRSRLTAAWLIGFDRREHFRDVLGDLLLASQLCFSGQGYCFALARFGTEEDAQHLTAYLDRYLRQPDCQYDQHWAISTLLHIDSQTGSEQSARFLAPGGLWHQWNEAQYRPSPPSRFMDELCAFAADSEGLGSMQQEGV